ncbi:hypothetical protein GEMRC1_004537 [Eukaryota sp. GEM-RC1]
MSLFGYSIPGRLHRHNHPQVLAWNASSLIAYGSGTLVNLCNMDGVLLTIPAASIVTCVALSPSSIATHENDDDSSLIVFSDVNGNLTIWDTIQNKLRCHSTFELLTSSLSLSESTSSDHPHLFSSLSFFQPQGSVGPTFLLVTLANHPIILLLNLSCEVIAHVIIPSSTSISSVYCHPLFGNLFFLTADGKKSLICVKFLIESMELTFNKESILTFHEAVLCVSPKNFLEFSVFCCSSVITTFVKNPFDQAPAVFSSIFKEVELTGPKLNPDFSIFPPSCGFFSNMFYAVSSRSIIIIYHLTKSNNFKAITSIDPLKNLNKSVKDKSAIHAVSLISVMVNPWYGYKFSSSSEDSLLLSILTSDGRLALHRVEKVENLKFDENSDLNSEKDSHSFRRQWLLLFLQESAQPRVFLQDSQRLTSF